MGSHGDVTGIYLGPTLLKFNGWNPENDGIQKESPFPGADFQVPRKKLRGVHEFR